MRRVQVVQGQPHRSTDSLTDALHAAILTTGEPSRLQPHSDSDAARPRRGRRGDGPQQQQRRGREHRHRQGRRQQRTGGSAAGAIVKGIGGRARFVRLWGHRGG